MFQTLNLFTFIAAILLALSCQALSDTSPMCPGLNGRDGRDGANGLKGDPGPPGETGALGAKGNIGAPGKAGPTGPKGNQGDKGDTGATGAKGSVGAPGNIGISGLKGNQGDKGSTGAKGEKGDRDSNLESRIISLEKSLSVLKNSVHFQMTQTTSGNKMYSLSWREDNFARAQVVCEKFGGTLPMPMNNDESSAIYLLAKVVHTVAKKSIFLGMNDIKQEGVFVYPDGKKITYTNWNHKEPNGGRSENCIQITDHGKWIDITCERINQVVCEFTVQ
ncbi:mannose-binding protein A-like isoform 1-T1 [Discoglossus pictus]